jgi:Raf kinase inhibitor-like YbhB/YbcL family protein
MTLTSTGFSEGAIIPAKFTCDGTNVNPQLQWANVPTGTQSFAIIVDDPDAFAAFGVVWVHWNAHNISSTATQIAEGASNHSDQMPVGTVEDVSDFGSSGYRGPCPPSGSHHYHFAVYALNKATIAMTSPSTRGEFESAHLADILDKAEVIGLFR